MASAQHLISRRNAFGALAFPLLPWLGFSDSAPPAGYVPVQKFGAKGDGVADDTEALTWAHSTGSPIFYPRTEAFYRISHVLPVAASAKSNGAEICIVGDGTHPKTIFKVSGNTAPIEISGFVLDGGYKGGQDGQWSHGIDVSGGHDVTVTNNTIRNTYGDCVYVGSSDDKAGSDNIKIRSNHLVRPLRCNVAVVCGENVLIENNTCIKEIDFVSGIDLEPDINGYDRVRRIRILNNNFEAKGKFITAGVNNGIENTDLVVSGNHGHALEFIHVWDNALLRNVAIRRNIFSSTSRTGVMLHLESVRGGDVSDNLDQTPCSGSYQSTSFRDCQLSLARNKFCS